MGANKNDFTEEREQNIVKVSMYEDYYINLPPYVRENMTVDYVKVKNPEYLKDEKWIEANKKASKSYSALKVIEHEINHK